MSAPYDRATLEAAIVAAIYSNISNDIVGDVLQGVLLDIVDSVFNLVDEEPLSAGDAAIALQTFVSSGTYTPTSGARKALMIATGSGGGGGVNSGGSATGRKGGAGGSGATAIKLVDLTGITSEAVTIAAAASVSANGGSSSIGSHVVAGGGSVGGSNASAAGADGGAGGTATAGDILLAGQKGPGSIDSGSFDISAASGTLSTAYVRRGAPSFWGGSYGRGGDSNSSSNQGFAMVLEFG